MSATNKKGKIVAAIVVSAFAAAYFLLAYNRHLNASDEGYLLYNFDRFARGDLPHRDFFDIYGALTYLVGGGLFKLFGTKILVIRVFLVLMKTAMATLIFLIGCRLMPISFAAFGSVLFTLCWGDPLFPLFTVLYGSHCVYFLGLLGILFLILHTDDGSALWLLSAGFCAGLALLFKLSTGIMLLLGYGLFLCFKGQSVHLAGRKEGEHAEKESPFARSVSLMKVMAFIAVAGALLFLFSRMRLDAFYFAIFLLPLFLFLGLMAAREIPVVRGVGVGEAESRPANFRNFAIEIILLIVGPIFLLLAYALIYYRLGGLEDMIYGTFALPAAINYFWPLRESELHAVYAVGIGALGLIAAAVIERAGPTGRAARRALFWAPAVVLPALALYGLICGGAYGVWHTRVTHVLPTATLLLVFPLLVRENETTPEGARRKVILSLLYASACLSLIIAFPRSDEAHIVGNSTVIFVLLAFLLWRTSEAGGILSGETGRVRRAAWALAVSLPIVIPFLWSLKILLIKTEPPGHSNATANGSKSYPVFELQASRANGLRLPVWKFYTPPLTRFEQVVPLDEAIEFVRDHTRPDEKIFVISSDQIIYFLSERDTFLSKDNYFIFLSNYEFIDLESHARLSDERLVQQLAAAKPSLVIQRKNDRETQNFFSAWPRTTSFIRLAYSPVHESEWIQILKLRGAESTGTNQP